MHWLTSFSEAAFGHGNVSSRGNVPAIHSRRVGTVARRMSNIITPTSCRVPRIVATRSARAERIFVI